jgi:uncharacterized membrane protein
MPGPGLEIREVLNVLLIALLQLVVWGAILVGLVVLVLRVAGQWIGGPDALEIARRRYARGEISHAEYERLRDVLTHETPARKSA